jgi:four helix bundle suffix protein
MTAGLIPPSGGFRNLRSFQCGRAVYDGTVIFCNKFVEQKSRTHDQMVQAARSGVQNIAEGSLASATSKKTELKLTGVARASLGELLLDYEDYLRQHNLPQWPKNSPQALKVRGLYREPSADRSDQSDKSDPPQNHPTPPTTITSLYRFSSLPAPELANTLICLINQTSFLLWQQMKTLEKEFLTNGGFTEKMYAMRKKTRESL